MSNTEHVQAQVGRLEFAEEFSDPRVDVRKRQSIEEHNVISTEVTVDDDGDDTFSVAEREESLDTRDENVVQAISEGPATVTVTGVVYESQLRFVDELVNTVDVYVQTNRWTGRGVVTETRTEDTRNRRNGERLYNVTIRLKEVESYSTT